MEEICHNTQYTIALDQPLDQEHLEHLKICKACTKVKDEYQALQLIVSSVHMSPPLDFVDKVMGEIDAFEQAKKDTFGARLAQRAQAMVTLPKMQYLGLGIAGSASVFTLFRFALWVLIPH